MSNKTVIDKNVCLGCGSCVSIAPKSFAIGDDGKAQPINPPGDDDETVTNAANSCPVQAITFVEE